MDSSTIEIDGDEESKSLIDDDQYDDERQRFSTHVSRSSVTSISSTSTSNNGTKRQKDISPCYVCGAKAHGYNFDQSN